MTFKGIYDPGTTYAAGDVVGFNDEWFVMTKATKAGTPCTNTLYWTRASQMVSVVAKFLIDLLGMIPSAELPEEDGAYTFTATMDDGEATYSWESAEVPAGDEL